MKGVDCFKSEVVSFNDNLHGKSERVVRATTSEERFNLPRTVRFHVCVFGCSESVSSSFDSGGLVITCG